MIDVVCCGNTVGMAKNIVIPQYSHKAIHVELVHFMENASFTPSLTLLCTPAIFIFYFFVKKKDALKVVVVYNCVFKCIDVFI